MKKIGLVLLTGFLLLMLYFAWIKVRSLTPDNGDYPLAVRWEGFYHDENFRDVGASLNDCLGADIFNSGVLMRSAGWFSGWSCDDVGNPDVIFSLNVTPKKKVRYFCQAADGKRIGHYYNRDRKLNDLEFLDNWSDPEMEADVCPFIRHISQEILAGKKVLVHCDAGRDRTGTMAALFVALAAENRQMLSHRMVDAIECDYRKTKSLDPAKYGRMAAFIAQIRKTSTVTRFLSDRCGLSQDTAREIGQKFIRSTR